MARGTRIYSGRSTCPTSQYFSKDYVRSFWGIHHTEAINFTILAGSSGMLHLGKKDFVLTLVTLIYTRKGVGLHLRYPTNQGIISRPSEKCGIGSIVTTLGMYMQNLAE